MKVFIPGNGPKDFHDALLTATQEIRDFSPGAGDVNQRILDRVAEVDEEK